MLLAASQSKTEAENGATDDILPEMKKMAWEIGDERRPGPANPVYSFCNWLEYPVFKSHRPESFHDV